MLKTDKMTPNVKKLFLEFWTKRTIDKTGKSFGDIASSLVNSNGKVLSSSADNAFDDLNVALAAVRCAAQPNPLATASDEEIASAILERVDARRQPK
jgi:hypothetical protein